MSITQLNEIAETAERERIPFWQVVLEAQCREQDCSPAVAMETMLGMYRAMEAADRDYDPGLRSISGMAGGDGEKLRRYRLEGGLLGPYLGEVMEKAVKMAESNACMKRIVAAPTAGSCGVIPAVLLTYQRQKQVPEEQMVEALFTAAGIGEVIACNASIAGAEGGCQAEIGAACAMAAGAVIQLEGGSPEAICHGAALAIKSLLGLTCDPVAGLVEVPCVKRNASGAVLAVTAAQMALAGIRSAVPPDEVIDSMRRIGRLLPACLRETSQEGLAITPTAMEIARRLRGNGENHPDDT